MCLELVVLSPLLFFFFFFFLVVMDWNCEGARDGRALPRPFFLTSRTRDSLRDRLHLFFIEHSIKFFVSELCVLCCVVLTFGEM
jgi:hypothetical protein